MLNMSVVVIDDDAAQCEILGGFLRKLGCEVLTCNSGAVCIEKIKQRYVDVVISDFRMPGMTGLEVLQKVKEINPEIQVLILTAYGTVEDAVEAMQSGAWDYLSKPVDLEELELKLRKIAAHNTLIRENQVLRSQVEQEKPNTPIIYQSNVMAELLNLIARVSDSNAAILIQGESGTGKELVAKTIHSLSSRKDKPFVAVNCAAIPETLFESELFGHEKGAFTGAQERRTGRFEIADGGTLFLDEVADIPLNIQVKLLRVLQEKEFQRLGSSQSYRSDARIISATNKDIQKMIDDGKFRPDLYFRLGVIPVSLPALRERREDIKALAEHFMRKHSDLNRRKISGISSEGLDILVRYDFPGNVRELENLIERAVILARSEVITTDDLPIRSAAPANVSLKQGMNGQIEELEIRLIQAALNETKGIQTAAAEKLGISERTLRYKIQKYGLGT